MSGNWDAGGMVFGDTIIATIQLEASHVPEPTTALLLGFGLAAALAWTRRARTSARSCPL